MSTSGTAGGSAAFLSRSLVGPILAKSKALRPCCEFIYVEHHTKQSQRVVEYGGDKGGGDMIEDSKCDVCV